MDSTQTPMFIYGLVDPRTNQIRYVGKTNRPAVRVAEHCQLARRQPTTHCHWWINSLRALDLKPILMILEETIESAAGAVEARHIERLRSSGVDLTNLTDGGDGASTGEANAKARLTDQQIVEMLTRYCAGERISHVAHEYGMHEASFRRIVRGDVRTGAGSPDLRRRATERYGHFGRGAHQWMSKLRDEDIPEIVRLYSQGVPQKTIALQYGLTQATISHIVTGKGWKHVGRDRVPPQRRNARFTIDGQEELGAKLTEEKVREIRRRIASGEFPSKLAPIYRVSVSMIYQIVRRKRWAQVPD